MSAFSCFYITHQKSLEFIALETAPFGGFRHSETRSNVWFNSVTSVKLCALSYLYLSVVITVTAERERSCTSELHSQGHNSHRSLYKQLRHLQTASIKTAYCQLDKVSLCFSPTGSLPGCFEWNDSSRGTRDGTGELAYVPKTCMHLKRVLNIC